MRYLPSMNSTAIRQSVKDSIELDASCNTADACLVSSNMTIPCRWMSI
jgi:hypothetical protein